MKIHGHIRVSSPHYSIPMDKMVQIGNLVEPHYIGYNHAVEYILGDWADSSHQQWLDTAPAETIAAWVVTGLRGAQ